MHQKVMLYDIEFDYISCNPADSAALQGSYSELLNL
jgi:hypothetical protein